MDKKFFEDVEIDKAFSIFVRSQKYDFTKISSNEALDNQSGEVVYFGRFHWVYTEKG
jgi:hypothetical protein